ncbi:MAG TPA: threonine--tRNA ligase [Clostridia bacterium]|nr:threonine--tRNA ligase [Clostridia bacterium]
MKIKLRDDYIDYEDGKTLLDIAKSISEGLARNSIVAKVNGKAMDMNTALSNDAEVEFLTFKDEDGKKAYRHSSSHILAQAVKHLYPDVKDAIGPAIENGFYYDFDFATPLDKENGLEKIEEEMRKIIKADYKFEREEVSKQKAMEMMKDEPYKLELIEGLPKDAIITLYRQGDFIDLCTGPHVPSTGFIKALKLTSATGAYWRGDEKRKMLTRIYGTSFDKKSDLDEYLERIEDAKKRDHNKLGREMEIFMTDENIGQGLPLLMPKGAKLMQILQRFVEDEESRRGYLLTKTPYMAKRELYKVSGHWDHYKDGMFIMGDPDAEGEVFALRPMTCPFQYTIYNNGLKSYKDLPLRYGETSTLFRNESSGEMHGLIRVRQFTISEGHLVCMPSQLEQEFTGCLNLAMYMLKCLGLLEDVSFRFSRWDPENTEKYINEPEQWNYAENEMKRILDDIGIDYQESIGEAAFYGPKLDIQIKNVFGKEDTLVTIQIDMFLAKRFDMTYIDENNTKVYPYIIHRTSLGCYERSIALLIEKYAGAFPLWMAPTQVKVISLTDRTTDDVKEIASRLNSAGIRAEEDSRNESMKYKVRDFQMKKIPYALIIGDKEKAENVVAVRDRKDGMIGAMTLDAFITKIKEEIATQISY